MSTNSEIHSPVVRAAIAEAIQAARNFERKQPGGADRHLGNPWFLFGYLKQKFDFFVEQRMDKERAVIAAMLNANVTLNSVSDNMNVPENLARQARRDALALSEAIQLSKSTTDN